MNLLKQLFFDQGMFVIFPAIVGLFRWPNLRTSDKPIILVCFYFLINELVRSLLIKSGYNGFASYNIGALITALLYLWQFAAWGIFGSSKRYVWMMALSYVFVWLFDHLFMSSIHKFSFLFRLYLVLSLIIMSLVHLNKLITTEKKSLFSNGRFIITCGILFYNMYRIIVDSFNRTSFSNDFLNNLGDAHRFVLLGLYSFYLIGIICLPKKKTFFMPS